MWTWNGTEWVPSQKQLNPTSVPQAAELVSQPERTGGVFGRKSPEEKAQREAEKQRAAAQKEAARRQAAADKEAAAFARSPVGQARAAFAAGDHVFQYSRDVMSQQAIIIAMVGSATSKSVSDPSDVLNAVCREGWDLVNGSFVFVEQGQESRDKFLASGQNVAIKGTTVGYYLFRRCPENRPAT